MNKYRYRLLVRFYGWLDDKLYNLSFKAGEKANYYEEILLDLLGEQRG